LLTTGTLLFILLDATYEERERELLVRSESLLQCVYLAFCFQQGSTYIMAEDYCFEESSLPNYEAKENSIGWCGSRLSIQWKVIAN
jgi:hypothetical protein